MKKILFLAFLAIGLHAAGQDTTITKMEYFIDADPGVGNGTALSIPPLENVTFSFNVDISGYSVGYHKLYLRTRDNLGRWSITARRNIEVLPLQEQYKITNGEYFIDTDPGYGNGKGITVTNSGVEVLQDFSASLTGLEIGYHKLYGRFKDNNGNWSQTFRRNIEVINDATNLISNGEYFFKTDNGFGNCTPVTFGTPASDGSFSFNISAAQIPADADTIFVRVRQDGQNLWSLTRWSVVNTALPLTWLNFAAVRKQDIVALNWQTTNEINTPLFNVQRSTDAVHFINIGIVQTNNRPGVNNYIFNDPIDGISANRLFYRLQQMDLNGDAQFSKTVSINLNDRINSINIYPNPFTDHIIVLTENPSELLGATLTVADLSGKTIFNQKLTTSGQQKINLSGLARGMYLLQINKHAGKEVYKIIKE